MRPAWASWMPATDPMELINSVIGLRVSACSSVHIPRQPGVILPRDSTAVASVKTRPTPPRAKVLRWANCQLEATPLFAEYIHRGDNTILLRNNTLRIFRGENNFILLLIIFSFQLFH